MRRYRVVRRLTQATRNSRRRQSMISAVLDLIVS
jgi:hypothetical protein